MCAIVATVSHKEQLGNIVIGNAVRGAELPGGLASSCTTLHKAHLTLPVHGYHAIIDTTVSIADKEKRVCRAIDVCHAAKLQGVQGGAGLVASAKGLQQLAIVVIPVADIMRK